MRSFTAARRSKKREDITSDKASDGPIRYGGRWFSGQARCRAIEAGDSRSAGPHLRGSGLSRASASRSIRCCAFADTIGTRVRVRIIGRASSPRVLQSALPRGLPEESALPRRVGPSAASIRLFARPSPPRAADKPAKSRGRRNQVRGNRRRITGHRSRGGHHTEPTAGAVGGSRIERCAVDFRQAGDDAPRSARRARSPAWRCGGCYRRDGVSD